MKPLRPEDFGLTRAEIDAAVKHRDETLARLRYERATITPPGRTAMQHRFYDVCSNPECNFNASSDDRTHGCPRCGANILLACPHCNESFRYKDQIFCTKCQKRIKAEPAPAPEPEA